MLGFGKKKKNEVEDNVTLSPAEEPDKGKGSSKKGTGSSKKAKEAPAPPPAAAQTPAAPPKKKRFSIKKLIVTLVILGLLGGGGFAGYTFFFKPKGPEQRVYKAVPLAHLTLPKEMLKFTFTHFPDLYDAFIQYETEVSLFENEIQRIDAIAAKYPEQQKIADRQKKIWEKGKNTLLKEFAKLEKPVKETFVLYQVNPKQGQEQIDSTAKDLSTSAQDALKAAQELTEQIKAMTPKAPEGMIRGTLYKLKKKFL